jgi:hypothetical protein
MMVCKKFFSIACVSIAMFCNTSEKKWALPRLIPSFDLKQSLTLAYATCNFTINKEAQTISFPSDKNKTEQYTNKIVDAIYILRVLGDDQPSRYLTNLTRKERAQEISVTLYGTGFVHEGIEPLLAMLFTNRDLVVNNFYGKECAFALSMYNEMAAKMPGHGGVLEFLNMILKSNVTLADMIKKQEISLDTFEEMCAKIRYSRELYKKAFIECDVERLEKIVQEKSPLFLHEELLRQKTCTMGLGDGPEFFTTKDEV